MAWNNPTDTERIRHRLGFSTAQLVFIQRQQDLAQAMAPEAVATAQSRLDELDALDTAIATASTTIDHIQKADVVTFWQGGQTSALKRRARQLIEEVADVLQMEREAVPALTSKRSNMLLRS